MKFWSEAKDHVLRGGSVDVIKRAPPYIISHMRGAVTYSWRHRCGSSDSICSIWLVERVLVDTCDSIGLYSDYWPRGNRRLNTCRWLSIIVTVSSRNNNRRVCGAVQSSILFPCVRYVDWTLRLETWVIMTSVWRVFLHCRNVHLGTSVNDTWEWRKFSVERLNWWYWGLTLSIIWPHSFARNCLTYFILIWLSDSCWDRGKIAVILWPECGSEFCVIFRD